MAFRGRGRGRGRGGGGFGSFIQEPFHLYPTIENLPNVKDVKEEGALVVRSSRLHRFWKLSPYYLKDKGPRKDESTEIERFSDRGKQISEQKHQLSDFIKCSVEYVPAELVKGHSDSKAKQRRKVRWNQEPDLQKFDLFEKHEQRFKEEGEKDEKEKEGENEEEDNERIEEEDEEFSDDGDYNQNIDFDDDEDDFNMDDDNDDEGIF